MKAPSLRKLVPLLFIIALVVTLQGCASGSYQLTGNKRPEIQPDQVTLFEKRPSFSYEVIGHVSSYSERGFSEASRLAKAKEELKVQAAKIGANGVILDDIIEKPMANTGSGVGLSFGSGGMIGTSIGTSFSLPQSSLRGTAIYYQATENVSNVSETSKESSNQKK